MSIVKQMFLWTLRLWLLLCLTLPGARVIAQVSINSSSDNYSIQYETFSSAGQFSTSTQFQIDDCMSQPSAVGGASSANFMLSDGFLAVPSILPIISTDNRITNGEFSNSTTGWTLQTFESGRATGSIQNGEYVISISNGSDQFWHIELLQSGLLIEKGKKYNVSFDAYASSPRRIYAWVGLNSDPWTPYCNFNHIDLTTTKQTFTYSFVMNSETDPATRILFQCGTSSADVILDNIVLSQGTIDLTKKRYEAPQLPTTISVPTIDGKLDDIAWRYAGDVETLSVGGWVENWRSIWMNFSNNRVQWRAVWSAATNLLYVAVEVEDDVAGAIDHSYGLLWADDCVEFFTDGDRSGGLFEENPVNAQGWMIRRDNVRYLNYTSGGLTGSAVASAVQHGNAGNWTLEAALEIYNQYQNNRKQLQTGDVIGWDVWYNDSDNIALDEGKFGRDRQVGWGYIGQAYLNANFMQELEFGEVGTITAFEESRSTQVPKQLKLYQNYPNPFNPSTTLQFIIHGPKAKPVVLSIYNLLGHEVIKLVDDNLMPGVYSVTWNCMNKKGQCVSSGIYLARLSAGNEVQVQRMILNK